MDRLIDVIYEDSDLLVINKPAGLVCHPTKGDEFSSLISRARLHCGSSSLHLVNRLDRETSGVVLIAKNSGSAGELGKIWESRSVEKEYLAVVHGSVALKSGTIREPLGKDMRSEVAVKDSVRPDGAHAQTDFETDKTFSRGDRTFSLLRLFPKTGRKHQLRIHLSYIGHPIVGDKLYGCDPDAYLALVQNRLTEEQRKILILPNQALHAHILSFRWRAQNWKFCCDPDSDFRKFAMLESFRSEPNL